MSMPRERHEHIYGELAELVAEGALSAEIEATYQLDQFTPIARLTADPTVLAVRADSPWKSLQEFIDDARKRPGAITYGSSGNYGTMHVPMEMFAHSAGLSVKELNAEISVATAMVSANCL